jgi:hypothetical protein
MKAFLGRFAPLAGLAASVILLSDAAMATTRPRPRPRPVPGPAPIIGVILAAGWMRNLRKQVLMANDERLPQ